MFGRIPATAPAAPAPAVQPAYTSLPPAAAPAPVAAPVDPLCWVTINGATVPTTVSGLRTMPADTPAMLQAEAAAGWKTAGEILARFGAPAQPQRPAASAPLQPVARPAFGGFGGRAPAQQAAPAQHAPAAGGGLFDGIEDADVFRRGQYIEPGNYVVRVHEASYKESRDGSKKWVILELEVLTTSYRAEDPNSHQCHQVGARVTCFVKKNDSFLSNMKEIILALSGYDQNGQPRDASDTVSQQECAALISPEQPYAGAIAYIEAREVPTRNNGKYTRVQWWPCPVDAQGHPDLAKLSQQR